MANVGRLTMDRSGMFIDIKKQIQTGDKVPLTLIVKGPDGKQQKLDLQAKARMMGGMPRH
jgi:copper(I)-binding protein